MLNRVQQFLFLIYRSLKEKWILHALSQQHCTIASKSNLQSKADKADILKNFPTCDSSITHFGIKVWWSLYPLATITQIPSEFPPDFQAPQAA